MKDQWISVVLGDGKTWSNIKDCKIIACDERAQEIFAGAERLADEDGTGKGLAQ